VLFGSAQVYDSTSGGYSQDAWIVKLDSNGCDIDTCPHIVSSASLHEPLSNGEYIRCVPNPTSGVFAIGLPMQNATIKMYNAIGVEVTFVKKQNEINISALPTGLYIVQVSDGKRMWWSKVVKQ
jgi:hypothetical protein